MQTAACHTAWQRAAERLQTARQQGEDEAQIQDLRAAVERRRREYDEQLQYVEQARELEMSQSEARAREQERANE